MADARKSRIRSPGRPPKSRGDERERLLDVAIALFSRHGIAATPLSAIAKRARVTPAMLHYYFGQRERLLDALVEERIVPLMATLQVGLDAPALAPRARISAFVRDLFALLGANPWLPTLWLREVLSDGGLLRERLLVHVGARIAPRLSGTIAAAQAQGELNPDLDPRLVVVSLIGLTLFPLAARALWTRVLDAAEIGPDELAQHTLALLEHGLGVSR
ncbi:MAG: TetR/AcrR family transcriptional regulator [Dokdonella sp.]